MSSWEKLHLIPPHFPFDVAVCTDQSMVLDVKGRRHGDQHKHTELYSLLHALKSLGTDFEFGVGADDTVVIR